MLRIKKLRTIKIQLPLLKATHKIYLQKTRPNQKRCNICGIAGFIGRSTNQKLTFNLISHLFSECESRGTDAAGFWGTEVGEEGPVVYHKEPTKSSELINKKVWKDLEERNLDLLLVHARGASQGSGLPSDNKNNHPFVSYDKSVGLVHNGKIPDSEYSILTKKYEVASKCDSEILLRIIENGNGDENLDHKLAGIKDVWSFIDKGHMAVAMGDRNKDERRLFLFRNKHRSIWLADLRAYMGQIFFCSTPEIWHDAFTASGLNRIIRQRIKLVELPTEEVWVMNCSEIQPRGDLLKKYNIVTNGRETWTPEGDIHKIIRNKPSINVVTQLSETDEVIYEVKKETKEKKEEKKAETKALCHTPSVTSNDFSAAKKSIIEETPWYGDNTPMPELEDIEAACAAIKTTVTEFQSRVNFGLMYQTLSASDLLMIMSSLEEVQMSLEGTIKIISR